MHTGTTALSALQFYKPAHMAWSYFSGVIKKILGNENRMHAILNPEMGSKS